MDKQELIKDMKRFTGAGFITRQKLAEYMGIKDPKNVDKYLRELEKISGKYYFIPDVAKVMKSYC